MDNACQKQLISQSTVKVNKHYKCLAEYQKLMI